MRSSSAIAQLGRFLQVGIVNTLFGYALYALLVAIGLQLFAAQVGATVIAVAFNYVSYGRYVFDGGRPSKYRFLLSYGLNYLVSVAALAAWAAVVPSPYLAGALAMLMAVTVNFVVLRRWVFASRVGRPGVRPVPAVGVGEANGASCG